MHLDLQRRAQHARQHVDGLDGKHGFRVFLVRRARTQEPADVFALAAGDTVERKHGGVDPEFAKWYGSTANYLILLEFENPEIRSKRAIFS